MKSRLSFASRWLKLAKNGRSPAGAVRRYLLMAMAVLVFAFGLVTVGGDPPLLDAEPAAAHHCDSYSGDWQAVCEYVHACTNNGGTVSQGTCLYPTTTTTTTTTTPPPVVRPVTATCHRHGSYFVNNECHTHPTNKACDETVWVHTHNLQNLHTTYTVTASPPCTPPTTTTTTTTTPPPVVRPVTVTCHRHGSHFVNNECHTHPTNKACGETVWVHTHDLQNLHTTYEVTAIPPCDPPPCPVGEHWFAGACQSNCITGLHWVPAGSVDGRCLPRCPSSQHWVPLSGSDHGSCEPRCQASEQWINGACEARCPASEQWINGACEPRCPATERWIDGACVLRCGRGEHRHSGTIAGPPGTSQTDTCHSGHSHTTCPTGQFKAPLPEIVSYRHRRNGSSFYQFYLASEVHPESSVRNAVAVEWVTMDAHTGCKLAKHPEANQPCAFNPVIWGCSEDHPNRPSSLLGDIKSTIEASGDFLVKTIAYVPGSDVINLVLCAYPTESSAVGQLIANSRYVEQYRNGILISRRAFARTNLAGAAFDLALEQVYCSALRRAGTTTTTTTTTTVPPTTTTTVPPTPTTTTSLPVVTSLPNYDNVNYRARFFYNVEAVPSSCTPWVEWQVQPMLYLLVVLCPR